MSVKAKDSLLFSPKNYFFTRLKLSQENIDQNNIIVNMIIKPEELNEVVSNQHKICADLNTSQQDLDDSKIRKRCRFFTKIHGRLRRNYYKWNGLLPEWEQEYIQFV